MLFRPLELLRLLLLRLAVLFRLAVLLRLPLVFRLPLLFRLLLLFRLPVDFRAEPPARRFRVAAAFRADAERAALLRVAEALPPFLPPLRELVRVVFLPRPDPLFFPPPVSLLTVAHARRSASLRETPRSSYPSSMCRACRFCLDE